MRYETVGIISNSSELSLVGGYGILAIPTK